MICAFIVYQSIVKLLANSISLGKVGALTTFIAQRPENYTRVVTVTHDHTSSTVIHCVLELRTVGN